jgi:Domain of unknown function (DUF4136)
MRTVTRVITISTTVALLCVPAVAQKVTDDVRRGDNVSELRTFTITDTTRANVQPSQTWWAYEKLIDWQNTNAAVAAQLEARGFRRDDAHPDMYVTTLRTVRTEVWGYGWSGWGDKHWSHYGYGSHYLDSDIDSTLLIDVTSAHSGELLWRGISMREVDFTSNHGDRLERINKEVRKVFKEYPFGLVATTGRGTPTPMDR